MGAIINNIGEGKKDGVQDKRRRKYVEFQLKILNTEIPQTYTEDSQGNAEHQQQDLNQVSMVNGTL